MRRYLTDSINDLSSSKLLLLSGPRQVGKTTLSNQWLGSDGQYFNWDIPEDRERILTDVFSKRAGHLPAGKLVLDEVHKFDRWKAGLKGLVDRHLKGLQIIVTGSARLDVYQKGGDSLIGRYENLRLHPLSVAEVLQKSFQPPPKDWMILKRNPSAQSIWIKLEKFSGFPEPFLKANGRFYTRWSTRRRR